MKTILRSQVTTTMGMVGLALTLAATPLRTGGNLRNDSSRSLESLPPDLRAAFNQRRHAVEAAGAGHKAYNPSQRYGVEFDGASAAVRADDSDFRISIAGWGRPGSMQTAAAPEVHAEGDRIEYRRGPVTEWYVNSRFGLEQGFTLHVRPEGEGALGVSLAVNGNLVPRLESASAVELVRDGRTVLRYGGLKAWDAAGRPLASHMEVSGSEIRLIVEDNGAQYPLTIDPLLERARLTASDGKEGDYFGWSVALSDDTAVIGAVGNSSYKGAAYVFMRSLGAWVEIQRLTAPDGGAGDLFGYAASVSGNTLVIGAPYAPGGGAAYVFVVSSGVWTLQQKLAGLGRFAHSVSLSGDTAVIGDPVDGNGAVSVFVRNGNVWTLQQKLIASDGGGGDFFGSAVAFSADTVVIGAPLASPQGAAYVFVRSGNVWTQQQKLFASDGANGFGSSVALSGNTVLIGGGDGFSPGSAHVFVRSGNFWTQQQKLSAQDGSADGIFGFSVALSGNTAVVGSPNRLRTNAAYVFLRTGSLWTQHQKLIASDGGPVGWSMALSNDTLITGGMEGASNKPVYAFQAPVVTINTNYPGQKFEFVLSGQGCPVGALGAPAKLTLLVSCTIAFTSPYSPSAGQRYTFQSWYDGVAANSRTLPAPQQDIAYVASFGAEYQLSTASSPPSGGSVTGAAWYAANTVATVAAVPSPGYLFNGFTGGLSGTTTPQQLLMNGPKSVTGNFLATPPANLTAAITGKSGLQSSRLWTIALTNSGPGTAYGAQIHGIQLTQTFGASCVPVRLSPAAFPISLGNIGAGGSSPASVTWDFSSCGDTARFSLTTIFSANSGSSVGLTTLVNQLR